MTELKKTGRVNFEAISTIALIVFCIFGCSIEDVAMKPVDSNFSDDSNLTSVVEPLPSLPVDPIHSPGSLDRAELDSLLEENLKKFAAEFSKTIPKPEKVDSSKSGVLPAWEHDSEGFRPPKIIKNHKKIGLKDTSKKATIFRPHFH